MRASKRPTLSAAAVTRLNDESAGVLKYERSWLDVTELLGSAENTNEHAVNAAFRLTADGAVQKDFVCPHADLRKL
jgi:hypothetical protein